MRVIMHVPDGDAEALAFASLVLKREWLPGAVRTPRTAFLDEEKQLSATLERRKGTIRLSVRRRR